MKLSQINTAPLYNTTIPSTGKKVKFRPLYSVEERALLAAQESEDVDVMLTTLSNTVSNCIEPRQENLTTFDIEYLFVQVRSKSVGETSNIEFTCNSTVGKDGIKQERCDHTQPIELDLKKVYVYKDASHTKNIKISEDITVQMKYPTIDELQEIKSAPTRDEVRMLAIRACMETVFVKDEVFHISEESEDEIEGFLRTLRGTQKDALFGFFSTMPETRIDVDAWECPSCGAKHEKTSLRGINSFF